MAPSPVCYARNFFKPVFSRNEMESQDFPQFEMDNFKIPEGYEGFVSSASELLAQFQGGLKQSEETVDFVAFNIFYDLQDNEDGSCDCITPLIKVSDSIRSIEGYQDYIWHREELSCKLIEYDAGNGTEHVSRKGAVFLQGSMKYGENIDDEWFVVYILLVLSRENPAINIRIVDADGEFLLIEAAEYLPDWMGPENSMNRIWIKQGFVHIIPFDEHGRDRNGVISLQKALNCLRNTPKSNTIASQMVQKMIFARTIDAYPAKIKANEHRVFCIVAKDVAKAIQNVPKLAAIAINSFNSSQATDTKHKSIQQLLKQMSRFGPNRDFELSEDMTFISLTLTRALYAQCMFKTFHPPKNFHQIIRQIATFSSTALSKALDIGIRLTCGLEIAYSQSKTMPLMDKKREWVDLSQGIVKVSASVYEKLQHLNLSTAICVQDYYQSIDVLIDVNAVNKRNMSHIIDKVLCRERSPEQMQNQWKITSDLALALQLHQKNEKKAAIILDLPVVDDDSWLYFTPEELDKEMADRMKQMKPIDPASGLQGNNEFKGDYTPCYTSDHTLEQENGHDISSLNAMVDGVKEFMKGSSEFDGINPRNFSSKAQIPESSQGEVKEGLCLDFQYLQLKIAENKEILSSSNECTDSNVNGVKTFLLKTNLSDSIEHLESSGAYDSDDEVDSVKEIPSRSKQVIEKMARNIFNLRDELQHLSEEVDSGDEGTESDDELEFDNEIGDNFKHGIEEDGESIRALQQLMDMELKGEACLNETLFDGEDVDIDKNLLQNILDAQAFQLGSGPNPMSQLLSSFGVKMPQPPPMHQRKSTAFDGI